ncbi:hypothetical protein ACN42_g8792 [Penicillium freii]|uniref:Uncharacterized protein n=1 Tax=Penicillium freii TaxID=48697 RepID=A0A124GQJ7_PENFR|nr:hypothetical protein ACN42_g8792 [Penicillium freii]
MSWYSLSRGYKPMHMKISPFEWRSKASFLTLTTRSKDRDISICIGIKIFIFGLVNHPEIWRYLHLYGGQKLHFCGL